MGKIFVQPADVELVGFVQAVAAISEIHQHFMARLRLAGPFLEFCQRQNRCSMQDLWLPSPARPN